MNPASRPSKPVEGFVTDDSEVFGAMCEMNIGVFINF